MAHPNFLAEEIGPFETAYAAEDESIQDGVAGTIKKGARQLEALKGIRILCAVVLLFLDLALMSDICEDGPHNKWNV